MSAPNPLPWIWQDGHVVANEHFRISPWDEAIRYGWGLFETTRTWSGKPWLWDEHLARICASARELSIALDRSRLPTSAEVTQFANAFDLGDVVIRLFASAGVAGEPGRIWMTAQRLPPPAPGLRLLTSDYRVSRRDPFASHKSMNYGARRLAHAAAREAGFDDALLLDDADAVLEATTANLFVRFRDGWRTPALDGGVLAGTARDRVLAQGAELGVQQTTIAHASLAGAEEAFATNSVVGVLPVLAIDERPLAPGVGVTVARRALGFQNPP